MKPKKIPTQSPLEGSEESQALGAHRKRKKRPQGRMERKVAVQKKQCRTCKEMKPAGEFYTDTRGSHGLSSSCKPCVRRRVALWEKANPDRKRENGVRCYNPVLKRASYERMLEKPGYKEILSERCKRYRDRCPEKHKARTLCQRAVRAGTLVRPTECSECKKSCKPEGHHDDYSKPLEVAWLCPRCHRQRHSAYRANHPKP